MAVVAGADTVASLVTLYSRAHNPDEEWAESDWRQWLALVGLASRVPPPRLPQLVALLQAETPASHESLSREAGISDASLRKALLAQLDIRGHYRHARPYDGGESFRDAEAVLAELILECNMLLESLAMASMASSASSAATTGTDADTLRGSSGASDADNDARRKSKRKSTRRSQQLKNLTLLEGAGVVSPPPFPAPMPPIQVTAPTPPAFPAPCPPIEGTADAATASKTEDTGAGANNKAATLAAAAAAASNRDDTAGKISAPNSPVIPALRKPKRSISLVTIRDNLLPRRSRVVEPQPQPVPATQEPAA